VRIQFPVLLLLLNFSGLVSARRLLGFVQHHSPAQATR
jgi:hypothetical protein